MKNRRAAPQTRRYPARPRGEASTGRILLILGVFLLSSPDVGRAQESFQSGSTPAAPPEQFDGGTIPEEDLHKYLSPDGRFIDHCRYWHDHPDNNTRIYGAPDHFPPGRMGETRSFNGVPSPYVSCAVDPCPPNGTICWRNPAKPPPPNAQMLAVLKAQGCEATPTGDLICGHPGQGAPAAKCHITNKGGIACDPNEQFAGGDTPSGPGDRFAGGSGPPGPGDQFAGGNKSPGPGDQFDGGGTPPRPGDQFSGGGMTPGPGGFTGDPSRGDLTPPPCFMPSPAQLAQPPDDGAVIVAYGDLGGDVAVAKALEIGGNVAVAMAMAVPPGPGTFTAPPKPTVLRGEISIGGRPTAPDHTMTLQAFATKSLRVPVTYKPTHRKPSSVSPQESTKIQLVLSGGTSHYDPDVGRQRFLAGLLQCMAARMKEKTQFGVKPVPTSGQSCKLTAKTSEPPVVFDDSIKNPEAHRAEAAKFYMDMFDEVLKHNKDLAKKYPSMEKGLGIFGPLLLGATIVGPYLDTLNDVIERDTALKQALARANGEDPRYAGRQIDPLDIGCLVGQDAADAYSFFIQASFGLGLSYDPAIHK